MSKNQNCLKSNRFFPFLTVFLSIIFVGLSVYLRPVYATAETVNFQGKIVRNDAGNEGLNVTAGTPACVVLGGSNDTCDFKVKYYSAATAGTLLGTEEYLNREIGEYNGIFNLVLGDGSWNSGSETSFRNIFINNTSVYAEIDFAPDGSTYTETFLDASGDRMGVRATPYAISASAANKQFQFNVVNDETGYTNISQGQVFYDGDNDVLRLYDGTSWLAIQASAGDLPSYWMLNEATTPDIIYSYTGLDVAFGGTTSTSPFFYDVSAELLTLTNTTAGDSFRVNDQAGDTTPFVIDANGQVGIGKTTPSTPLNVVGTIRGENSTTAYIDVYSTAAVDSMYRWATNSVMRWAMGVDHSDSEKLIIGTGADISSPKVTFDTSGKVGIGTTSPTASLDVAVGNVAAANVGFSTGSPIMVSRFDGSSPFASDFSGSSNGNLGQIGTPTGGVIYTEGKFGKGLQTAQYVQNLVPNPSLEVGTTGWSMASGNSVLTQFTTDSKYGTASGKLQGATDYAYSRAMYNGIAVSTTTTYTFSVYVKAGSTGAVGKTLLLGIIGDSSGETLSSNITLTNSWQRVKLSKTTDGSDTTLAPEIIWNADTSGDSFLFDAAQLEVKAYPTSYVDGSLGAGHSWSGTSHASSSFRTNGYLNYDFDKVNPDINKGSLSIWIKPPYAADGSITSLPAWGNYLDIEFATGTGNNNAIRVQNSTDYKLITLVSDSAGTGSSSINGCGADTWCHIAVTWDKTANVSKTYFNGALKSTGTFPNGFSIDGGKLFKVGGTNTDSVIDDLAIFPSALSDEEIYTIYKSNAPIQTEDQSTVITAGEILPVMRNGASQLILAGSVVGNVGIGTLNPVGFLSVRAATTSTTQINLESSGGVNPSTPTSGDLWWNGTSLFFYDGSTSNDLLLGGGGGSSLFTDGGDVTYLTAVLDDFALGGSSSAAPFFFDEGNELLTLTNITAGLSFRVNDEASDTTPFVIDADGNVGIGTATPSARLDIAGSTSTITNTSGDITINAASGYVSFAGDSFANVLDATFSGDVVLNGGQLQIASHASNPTSIGEGSVVYNSTDKQLYYYKDSGWSEVGKVYTGTTGQTLRHNGTDWEANSVLVNDGTNLAVNGQIQVGNYVSKPAGVGAGALVYDTALASLFVYDGTDWKAISTSQTQTTSGVVSSGSYLNLSHAFDTTDLLASAWVKVGSQWKTVQERWNEIDHDLENEYNKSLYSTRTAFNSDSIALAEGADFGTGADGNITVSGTQTYTTTNLISGRSCADGGDGVDYNVSALGSNYATLTSTPSTGCLTAGDEVLLINIQGDYSSSNPNMGNYETFRIQSISSNTVYFTSNKTRYYGSGATTDAGFGTVDGTQRVVIQRVPNYNNVTVNASSYLVPRTYNGSKGGVMFFRASGTVTVASGGAITSGARGWRGGAAYGALYGGDGGGSFCAGNKRAGTAAAGATGGNAGGAAYSNNYCGGGGGGSGTGWNYNGAYAGTAAAGSYGGAGGGGGAGNSSSVSYIGYGGGGGGGGGLGGPGGGGGAGGYAGGAGSAGGTSGAGGNGYNINNTGYSGGGGGGGKLVLNSVSSALEKLYFGSGGGGGGASGLNAGGSVYPGGSGAAGGGVVYISGNIISVGGGSGISAAGGSGAAGSGTYPGGGGGGGAGGSVKIIGNTVSLGSVGASAAGGGGGSGTYNGGAGGAGAVAVFYVTSFSGTSSPTAYSTMQPYYPYGVYNSPVEKVANSGSLGQIKWLSNNYPNTKVSVQTRAGDTPDPSGLTWFKMNNTPDSVSNVGGTDGRLAPGSAGRGDSVHIHGGSVVKDGGVYKMWYEGNDGSNWRIYYATSTDGVSWTKYDNTIPSASDTTGTNGRIPLGTAGKGDSTGAIGAVVIKDGSTYKMWYTGHNGSTWAGIYYATSPDGLTWAKYDNSTLSASNTTGTNGRIPLGSSGGDASGILYNTVIKDVSTYKMWYSGSDGSNWRIYYATSPDGLSWTKYDNTVPSASNTSSTNGRVPLGTSGRGDDSTIISPAVILDNGVYRMWYRGDTSLFIATSSDGLVWTKYNNFESTVSDANGNDGRVPLGTKGDSSNVESPKVYLDTFGGRDIYRMMYSGSDGGTWRIYSAISYPDNSSWEDWKPDTTDTNYKVLETVDTHTNWTGTNMTVAEGDVVRHVFGYEDENELTATNLAKLTSSTNGGYAEATISSIDLSGYDYISLWVNASLSGNTVTIGLGESAGSELTETITVDQGSVWQKIYWDISDIPVSARDAITKIRLVNNIASSNTIYLDNVMAENLIDTESGTEITSTSNNYVQYRVVMTTTDTAYRPMIYNVKLQWADGYRVEIVDNDNVRLYNYSGDSQELKLTIGTAGGSSGGDFDWTEAGGNIYRGSGNVGIGDTTPDTALKVVGALCVRADASDCAGNSPGTIYAVNTSLQSADLAEVYSVSDLSIEAGDVVSLKPDVIGEVTKADVENKDSLMGVISTNPGIIMNDNNEYNSRPVGLVGRLPVKVFTSSLVIKKGDAISATSLPGIGGVTDDPGYIIGRAIEDSYGWSEKSCEIVDHIEDIVWPEDKGKNESHPCFRIDFLSLDVKLRESISNSYTISEGEPLYIGKVMAYVNRTWYEPSWLTEGITELVGDYQSGNLTNTAFEKEGNRLITSNDVVAHSFNSNYGYFSILSGGTLNIGEDNFTVDSSGSVGVAGDILLGGRLRSNGDFVVALGGVNSLFEIQNSVGDTVFSVDSKGEVGGKGIYKTGWLKVLANDNLNVRHNFGEDPSNITILKSDNVDGSNFTSKGLGKDFYYERSDANSIKVYNNLGHDIFVKLSIER